MDVSPLSDSHEEHVASVDALHAQLRERRTARKVQVQRIKETCYRALSDTPSSGYKLPPPSPPPRGGGPAPPPPPPPLPILPHAAAEPGPCDTHELKAETVLRYAQLQEQQEHRRSAVTLLKRTAARTLLKIETGIFDSDELDLLDVDVDEIVG